MLVFQVTTWLRYLSSFFCYLSSFQILSSALANLFNQEVQGGTLYAYTKMKVMDNSTEMVLIYILAKLVNQPIVRKETSLEQGTSTT